ncbi:unnamed protein product [Musa acuminata subsp. burmannicoides]
MPSTYRCGAENIHTNTSSSSQNNTSSHMQYCNLIILREEKREHNYRSNPLLTAATAVSLLFLIRVGFEGGDREGAADPGGGLEGDPLGLGIVNVHVGDGDPDEELPALDPGHPFHPAVLHEGRYLRRVRHRLSDGLEDMGGGLVLPQPHEPGGPVVADLLHGRQRKEGLGQVELRQ